MTWPGVRPSRCKRLDNLGERCVLNRGHEEVCAMRETREERTAQAAEQAAQQAAEQAAQQAAELDDLTTRARQGMETLVQEVLEQRRTQEIIRQSVSTIADATQVLGRKVTELDGLTGQLDSRVTGLEYAREYPPDSPETAADGGAGVTGREWIADALSAALAFATVAWLAWSWWRE